MINWYKLAQEDDELIKELDQTFVDVHSSFIDGIAYYDGASMLEVRFKNGKVYAFIDVPREIYEQFLDAPSKGNFFNKVILRRYTSS